MSDVIHHNPDELIELFNTLFAEQELTRLVRGDGEPIYCPADSQYDFHRVVFAHGFFSSALHEIAHWCVAGPERRLLEDFGYWYAPDGRSQQQQKAFEQVEIKPQALEWILSKACQKPFRVSVDNLSGASTDPMPFKQAVHQQVQVYCQQGLSGRVLQLRQALAEFYGAEDTLSAEDFSFDEVA